MARHPRVRDFRHLGMIWAFEVDSRQPDFSARFFAHALDKELLLRPLGRTVYFMPPYVAGAGEFELLARRTVELLDALPAAA